MLTLEQLEKQTTIQAMEAIKKLSNFQLEEFYSDSVDARFPSNKKKYPQSYELLGYEINKRKNDQIEQEQSSVLNKNAAELEGGINK